MSQTVDQLLEQIRQFRHNYYKYSHFHTKYLGGKVCGNLAKIRDLSMQLAKEVNQAINASEHKELMLELDDLLHIKTQKKPR